MKKYLSKGVLGFLAKFFMVGLLFTSISCTDDIIQEEPGILELSSKQLSFLSGATTKEIGLKSNIRAGQLSFEIPANAKTWLSVEPAGDRIELSVTDAGYISNRSTVLTVTGLGMRQVVEVNQKGLATELILNKDEQMFATSATATSAIENLVPKLDENGDPILGEDGNQIMIPGKDHHPANNILDGDRLTYHNSKIGAITEWPFIYEINFETPAEQIDYINFVARQDNGTRFGMFGEFDIFVSTTEKAEFTKVNESRFDAGMKDKATFKAKLPTSLKNVKAIKVELFTGYNNRASLAEMEFFKASENYDPLDVFTDGSFSKIKSGLTQEDIENISVDFYRVLADAIFNDTYDRTGFRIQNYRPYQNPKIKADENLTESYSIRDNPTGIYATQADELIYVFVGNMHKRPMTLMVEEQQVFAEGKRSTTEYTLVEGENKIKTSHSGLLYIKYLVSDDIALAPKTATDRKEIDDLSVTINILGGSVNGYYNSSKHTLDDWKRTLSYDVGSNIFDVQGDRIHLSWVKNTFRTVSDPTEVLKYWDTILVLEQKFLGLEKYNTKGQIVKPGEKDRKFRNRMYVHVHPGNPAATSNRLHFPHNTGMNYDDLFTKPEVLKERIWGPAHEMGHINQMRPGLNWGGTIETTNNIYCCYIQHVLGSKTRLDEQDYYTTAKKRLIEAYDANPTSTQLAYSGYSLDDASNFEKIVPWWQLYLYMKANGYEDFYKDLYEQYRIMGLKVPGFTGTDKNQSDNNIKKHGVLQTEFAVQACKAAKMDLREFFQKWGFLRTADMKWKDYQERIFKVTDERLKEIDKYIETEGKDWPKPSLKIWEITDQNYKEFKDPNFRK